MNNDKDIETLYSLYVKDLFTYAVYLGFDENLIMDAIHDVFYKISSDNNRLADVENVKFYLFRALKNRLVDLHRSVREHVSLSAVEDGFEMPFDIRVTVEDNLIDTEEQHLIKQQIEGMLNSLTSRQREIIYLRYVQEYDYPQIAQLLNITVHGCRKLVSKAIQNLREKYGTQALLFLFSAGLKMLN